MTSTFTCTLCRETFEFVTDGTWTRADATAEMESYFGAVPESEWDVVCDACYERIDPADHPEQVSASIRELKGDC
jgi:hypothetical protein